MALNNNYMFQIQPQWTTASSNWVLTDCTTNTLRFGDGSAPPDDEHPLTDMEWLDAEVDEVRELAFAA